MCSLFIGTDMLPTRIATNSRKIDLRADRRGSEERRESGGFLVSCSLWDEGTLAEWEEH